MLQTATTRAPADHERRVDGHEHTTPTATGVEPPRVWVLLGRGTGGNGQMTSLAEALGWPYETKQLVHNVLEGCPNILLGATSITITPIRWAGSVAGCLMICNSMVGPFGAL